MTLLERFISDANKGFIEPERRGVRKGHQIGMYRGSFNATLYLLYNYNKKEVAERANISHAFLRNLWTEQQFKDRYADAVDLYTNFYLYSYLTDNCIVKLPGVTYPDCETVDDKRVRLPFEKDELFADAANYSLLLKEFIAGDIAEYIEKLGIHRWLNSRSRLTYLLEKWNQPVLNKIIFSTVVRLSDDLIRKTLDSPRIPEALKEDALSCCKFMNEVAATL